MLQVKRYLKNIQQIHDKVYSDNTYETCSKASIQQECYQT